MDKAKSKKRKGARKIDKNGCLRCSRCKKYKPASMEAQASEFHWKKREGLFSSHCKTCMRIQRLAYLETEKGKASLRRYSRSEKGRAAHKRDSEANRARDVEKSRKYRNTIRGKLSGSQYYYKKKIRLELEKPSPDPKKLARHQFNLDTCLAEIRRLDHPKTPIRSLMAAERIFDQL